MLVSHLQECMLIIGILKTTEMHPCIKITHDIIAERLPLLCEITRICPSRLNSSLKRNSQTRDFIELKCYSTVLSTACFI